ncbi:uncharacterized protein SPPG_06854 [Spizellomyces punctatus DAOM BR117]|uniref:Uncharacterized protein n=1 Tax=Spizellomyces punctatus (strain DAOM BR117) TaxID=645134 RepID=A0A0L0HAW1_SPIPD|nr:uncharacterized protein SPPG_06854 [Spizellomyces punctatus DAOM BR117]KNC97858.1 hypothetical protein SPPG_06854 [Spizellomyces punctatus DAOM BR117]|eukprot:XP_016605898.1 hypothetical protein SPPG_06854 [Spizellomyces punctatus DAOM BR117]
MAILHNVYKNAPPPTTTVPHAQFPCKPSSTTTQSSAPSTLAGTKRKATELLPEWRVKLRRREVMSFAASNRQRIVNLLPNRSVALAMARAPQHHRLPPPTYSVLSKQAPEITSIPPMCHEDRALPTLDTLRDAMALEAQIEGLPEGLESEDCVKLVALALKNFMMNHLTTVLRMTRPITKPPTETETPSAPPPTPPKPRPSSTSNSPTKQPLPSSTTTTPPKPQDTKSFVSLSDICFTTDLAPHTITRTRGGLSLVEEATTRLDVFEGTIEEQIGPTRKSQLRELGIVGWK